MFHKVLHSTGAAAPAAPPAPLPSRVSWNPSLELSGGVHVPWAVPQPAKPILKVKEYDTMAQTGHWGDQAASTVPPPCTDTLQPCDSTRRPVVQPRRLKIVSKKRNRIEAFSQ